MNQILIVEDDPALGRLLVEILREEGLEATWVGSGQQALSLLRQGHWVVVLDWHLPQLSGYEVLQQISMDPQRVADTQVVLLSADARVGECLPQAALPLVKGCLPKPFELDELVACVRRLAEASADPGGRRGASADTPPARAAPPNEAQNERRWHYVQSSSSIAY